jgi:3-dehydroquinate dehydratase-2
LPPSSAKEQEKRMASLLLINGPNLNMLGTREPGVYGKTGLADIESTLSNLANDRGHELQCFQSNAEHEIVDRLQQANTDGVVFIIINPGAFTHTSIAIRDALLAVNISFIEVHLSNTFAREEFRHKSYFSDIAEGCIVGLGAYGYELALRAAVRQLEHAKEK